MVSSGFGSERLNAGTSESGSIVIQRPGPAPGHERAGSPDNAGMSHDEKARSVTDPVDLAAALVRCDTAGGNEDAVVAEVAPLLEAAGMTVGRHELAAGRTQIVATGRKRPRLVLSGHLDTVSATPASWHRDPWSGEVADGWLFGRGAADMKGGVAALVTAVARGAARGYGDDVGVVLTAAEETGCEGARSLDQHGVLTALAGGSTPPLVLIAEPTATSPLLGHKGVVWLRVEAHGRAAHASAPQLGVNAIDRLTATLAALPALELGEATADLGVPTCSVGTVQGGVAANVVPDWAAAAVDVRTVGATADELRARLQALASPGVEVAVELDLPPVRSHADDPRVVACRELAAAYGCAPSPDPPAATYFTDASVLTAALGAAPTVICGPGDPRVAHTVDERCATSEVEQMAEVYEALIGDVLTRAV